MGAHATGTEVKQKGLEVRVCRVALAIPLASQALPVEVTASATLNVLLCAA